jgi:APA family basic amino acid/polyamine antiporter
VLRRDLGFLHMTALTFSMMLGVGIFFGPTVTARQFPDARIVLAVWTLGGLVALCGAWLFGRLAALYPLSGGPYVYLREAFGPLPAYLFAWTSLVIIAPTSLAVMAGIFAQYLGVISPLTPTGVTLLALWSLVAFAFVNVLGVRTGGRVQAVAMGLKIVLLGAVISLLVVGTRASPPPASAGSAGGGAWSLAFAGVLFAYGGWEYAVLASEEVREGSRTIPKALITGAGMVTVLYLLATASYLAALGARGVAGATALASQAAGSVAPGAFALVVALGVALSAAGTINAVTLLGPRATFAAARDGLVPRPLARVSSWWGTPVPAILLQLALASAFYLAGNVDALASYTVIGTGIFIVLSIAALYRLRARAGPVAGARRTRAIEAAAAIVVGGAYAWFVVDSLVETPRIGFVAVGIVLAGLVPYALLRPRPRKPEEAHSSETSATAK